MAKVTELKILRAIVKGTIPDFDLEKAKAHLYQRLDGELVYMPPQAEETAEEAEDTTADTEEAADEDEVEDEVEDEGQVIELTGHVTELTNMPKPKATSAKAAASLRQAGQRTKTPNVDDMTPTEYLNNLDDILATGTGTG